MRFVGVSIGLELLFSAGLVVRSGAYSSEIELMRRFVMKNHICIGII